MTATSQAPGVAELLERDAWTREQLLAHQRRRLERLLRHASAHSAYYREALGDEPWERPLHALPTLSKEDLMAHWDRIVTDPALCLEEVEARVAAPGYDGRLPGQVHACATSGTTGRRGVFVSTPQEMGLWFAAMVRAFVRIGIGPETTVCAIGSPNPAHMSHQLLSPMYPARHGPPVSTTSEISEIARHVQRVGPQALCGYPTVVAALAEEQLRGRLDIAPEIVGVSSEVLTAEAADRIRSAWDVEPREAYPTTEVPLIASATHDDPAMLMCEDLVVVEPVDEHGAPVGPGEAAHKVLLTNLVNHLQPLIRYELPDVLTWGEPSGSCYRRVLRIDGRTSEIVELAGRDGGTVRVHGHRLLAAFAGLPGVAGAQLQTAPGRLTAVVLPAPEAPADVAEAARAALTAEVRGLGAQVAVAAQAVVELPRAASGKLPAVVVERDARGAAP